MQRAQADAERVVVEARTTGESELADLFAIVCTVFHHSVQLLRGARSSSPLTPAAFVSTCLRLEAAWDRGQEIAREKLHLWPRSPATSFAQWSEDSAAHIVLRLAGALAGAIGISRLRANEHVKLPDGQFPFPMGRPLPTVPVSDADPHAAILAWRELTAEEIRTRTLPPLDKWALWEMNRDLAAVESRLRDECDRATASSSTAKSAEPIARTPITEAPVRESWLRKSGDCWTLQFWTREGKLEAAVLPPRRGFELIHYFVYEPWRLACEIPEVSSGMEALDSNALGHAAAELLRLKESRVGQTGDALIDIDDKIETIERYMRQNTRPGGDIKLVMGERERAINRIRTNIRAALDHAKQHAPAWVEHMSEAIDYTLDPVPGYRPHEMVNWII